MSDLPAVLQVDLEGINLIIDEADNIWSTYVDQDRPFIPLQREGELYELMGGSPLNNSRIRTISLVRRPFRSLLTTSSARAALQDGIPVQVSATIAPIQWWTKMWNVKPQKFIADDQMLLEKGFADELHLKPVYPMLNAGDVKASNNYGWDHPSFRRVFEEFRTDTRPGRLMMVATTPRVRAGDNTVFHQAELTLADRCPEAACLVVHGGGINLLYRSADDPDAATGYGIPLKKVGCCVVCIDAWMRFDPIRRKPTNADRRCQMQTHDIKEVGSAIEFVDSTWGLQVPVIVFGYHCLGRSKSIRSDKRVITHLIVALQNGKTAAGTYLSEVTKARPSS